VSALFASMHFKTHLTNVLGCTLRGTDLRNHCLEDT